MEKEFRFNPQEKIFILKLSPPDFRVNVDLNVDATLALHNTDGIIPSQLCRINWIFSQVKINTGTASFRKMIKTRLWTDWNINKETFRPYSKGIMSCR